jgi:sulfite reductase alpha subunit
MGKKYDTPLLDELEKGPWPSFVTEIKKAATQSDMSNDELGLVEKSYATKRGYWKHGGIVGVLGYGGGIIGRYSSLPDEFPGVAHFHTVRINQPSGFFYTTKALREICDIWDKYGSGLTNVHGSTGDLVLLGTTTEALEPLFAEYSSRGAMGICNEMTQRFQDEMHRPAYPYKFKIKVAGCACDCVAAIARADCSIIGTWKGDIAVDQGAVKDYAKGGMDINAEIVDMCPTSCMSYDGKALSIDNGECSRCMHCITKMTKVVPFMTVKPPYDELYEMISNIIEWWDDNAKPRERIGELIEVKGMRPFLEAIGVPPSPAQVYEPRKDPFFFWSDDDFKK